METLTAELKTYNLTDQQIARIHATLNRGRTVRTTYVPDIDSIFLNDESTVTLVIVGGNGNEREIEREWK